MLDAQKLNSIRDQLEALCPSATFYVAGHLDHYSVSCFGSDTRYVRVSGEVDILVQLTGGEIKIGTRSSVGIGGATSLAGFVFAQVR
jgi:hypothetical protein